MGRPLYFALWFLLSFLLPIYLFSLSNLSRRRLDVCHTSTHGVALVRIYDAGLKMCCVRLAGNAGRKKSSKNHYLGTVAQLCRAMSAQLRHVSTIGKKALNSNASPICPHNMVNFNPLAAEIY